MIEPREIGVSTMMIFLPFQTINTSMDLVILNLFQDPCSYRRIGFEWLGFNVYNPLEMGENLQSIYFLVAKAWILKQVQDDKKSKLFLFLSEIELVIKSIRV